MERDCRKEVRPVVALFNSEGQTAGGTRERHQRRALATTPEGAGRVRRRNEKSGNIPISFFHGCPMNIPWMSFAGALLSRNANIQFYPNIHHMKTRQIIDYSSCLYRRTRTAGLKNMITTLIVHAGEQQRPKEACISFGNINQCMPLISMHFVWQY